MANPENKQIPYESTQKDIRDAIESVATAIGGIAIPSADHVSYDNSGSGLSATDVQNAIDELSSEKADSSSLATVATSGDYDDLVNKPTIPTVNDATLTIQKNGSDVATFTANASSNVVANVTVPTTTSELTNNSNFVSDASYVHTDNNFTNAEKTKLGGIESGAEVNVQSDWNEADNTKDDYIKNKPSSEVKSATDTFTTVNGGLLEECIINLVPVQSGSGDPYPAGGGKNKFGGFVYSVTQDGITASFDGSGKATLQGTASASTYIPDRTTAINNGYVFTLTAGTYTISTTNIPSQARIEIVKTDGTAIKIGDGSFTLTETTIIIVRLFITSGAVISNPITVDIQLEVGSTATDWSSYSNVRPISGHTQVEVDVSDGDTTQEQVTVNLGGTYYSGTLDVVTGVFTPDTAFDILSADNFNDETGTSGGGLHYYDWNNGLSKKSGICICSMMPQNNVLAWQSTTPCIQMSSGGGRIRCYVEEATKEAFKTAYSGMQIVYELANPTPIQLSPTMVKALVGENHLSAPLSGQSIDSVKYREVFAFDDVEKVVSLRVPISMLGTDESGRTTASQSYASGDYFYKDGYMCKALTSISAGATLTLNTNYSQGTLADILKAIENA